MRSGALRAAATAGIALEPVAKSSKAMAGARHPAEGAAAPVAPGSRREILSQIDADLLAVEAALSRRRQSLAEIDRKLNRLQAVGADAFSDTRPTTASTIPAAAAAPDEDPERSGTARREELAANSPMQAAIGPSFAEWLNEHKDFCASIQRARRDEESQELTLQSRREKLRGQLSEIQARFFSGDSLDSARQRPAAADDQENWGPALSRCNSGVELLKCTPSASSRSLGSAEVQRASLPATLLSSRSSSPLGGMGMRCTSRGTIRSPAQTQSSHENLQAATWRSDISASAAGRAVTARGSDGAAAGHPAIGGSARVLRSSRSVPALWELSSADTGSEPPAVLPQGALARAELVAVGGGRYGGASVRGVARSLSPAPTRRTRCVVAVPAAAVIAQVQVGSQVPCGTTVVAANPMLAQPLVVGTQQHFHFYAAVALSVPHASAARPASPCRLRSAVTPALAPLPASPGCLRLPAADTFVMPAAQAWSPPQASLGCAHLPSADTFVVPLGHAWAQFGANPGGTQPSSSKAPSAIAALPAARSPITLPAPPPPPPPPPVATSAPQPSEPLGASAPAPVWNPSLQTSRVCPPVRQSAMPLPPPPPPAPALQWSGARTGDVPCHVSWSTASGQKSFVEVGGGSFADGLEQWRPRAGHGSFQARTEATFAAPIVAAGAPRCVGSANATYNGPQPLPRAQPQCPVQ